MSLRERGDLDAHLRPRQFAEAHQPNESIPLAALGRSRALVRAVVERRCY